MTPEELMKPRYKVIADYPGCPFKVGQVLEKVKTVSGKWFVRGMFYQPDDYPANFKKMQWWEERKPDDMPEYIKFAHSGAVYKISKWKPSMQSWHIKNETDETDGTDITEAFASIDWHFQSDKCIPVTAAEYEAYLQTLTVKK